MSRRVFLDASGWLAAISERGSLHEEALDALEQDPAHEVRHVTRELERQAIDRWLRPYSDQGFSLTDAISFETMRVEHIDEAFSLDRHFRIAGFSTLPALT